LYSTDATDEDRSHDDWRLSVPLSFDLLLVDIGAASDVGFVLADGLTHSDDILVFSWPTRALSLGSDSFVHYSTAGEIEKILFHGFCPYRFGITRIRGINFFVFACLSI